MASESKEREANDVKCAVDHPGLDTPELISLAEFIQQTRPFNELAEDIL